MSCWARPSSCLFAIALLATGIVACGSSDSSSSPKSSSSQAEAPIAISPDAGGNAKGATGKSVPGAAGAAAPFVVPGADNSIPNYGSEASPSTNAEATSILKAYLEARQRGDWAEACVHLGTTPRRQLRVVAEASGAQGASCQSIYPRLTTPERADPLGGAIAALRVKGDRAFALFYGAGRHQYMIPMIVEGGSWKVNQVAPLSYPIGATQEGR